MNQIGDMGYLDLADSIIKQAVDDYLRNKKELYKLQTYICKKKNGKRVLGKERITRMNRCKRMIAECINFFKSDWYIMLRRDDEHTDVVYQLDRYFNESKYKIILESVV